MFSNREIEPKLFQRKEANETSNQETFRYNYLQNVLQDQQKVNHQFSEAYRKLNSRIGQSFKDVHQQIVVSTTNQNELINKFEHQGGLINHLLKTLEQQENENKVLLERLDLLENRNKQIVELIEQENLINQAILDQVSIQHHSTELLAGNIANFDSISTKLLDQLKEQENRYDEMTKQLEVQEVYHTTVMERLEVQEALTQKIIRQLENLRTVVYERASFISQRVEENFKKMVKPVQSFLVHQNDKEDRHTK